MIWSLGIIVNSTFKFDPTEVSVAFKILFDPIILEFFAGMIAARIFLSVKSDLWYVPVAAAAVGVMVLLFDFHWHRAIVAVVIAPAVLSAAMAEERFGFEVPSPLLLFGGASYAIYLVHNPVQSLVARAFRDADNWVLTFTACGLTGVALGLLYHVVYERPALRWLSRRSRAPNSGPLGSGSAV